MIEYKETRHTLQQKQISDLSLYSAGYEACAPGHHYGPIYRAYQLVHFILSGKGVLEIDGHTFQLGTGDAFLIPSGKIAYYAADTADPWCYTWINFLGINSQMYTYQLIASSPEPYVLHGLDTENIVPSSGRCWPWKAPPPPGISKATVFCCRYWENCSRTPDSTSGIGARTRWLTRPNSIWM